MSMTHGELALAVRALQPALEKGLIRKIYEDRFENTVLEVRVPGQNHYLLFCAHARFGRFHPVDGKPGQPQHPSAFTMLLRKYLTGARLDGLHLDDDDRVLRLGLMVRFDDGEIRRLALVLILAGRLSSLALCDEDGTVLGCSPGVKTIQVGQPLQIPNPPGPPDSSIRPVSDRLTTGASVDDPNNSNDLRVTGSFGPPTLRAIAEEIAAKERTSMAGEVRREVRSQLSAQRKKHRRLIKNIQGDLTRARQAEEKKVQGELLQSAYGKVDRGAKSVRVVNYYDPELAEVEIALDPSRSLQENIDRLFHEYRRMAGAMDQIQERLIEAQETLNYLEEKSQILDALDDEDIERLEKELQGKKLWRVQRAPGKKEPEIRLPYKMFTTRRGTKILVGRGAKANDELTTKHARGRDVWLHARDFAGAHVVLRQDKGAEPDGDDLLDAAILAAYFSRGKEDTVVDITWTYARHVKKPRGAAPGLVSVADGSTIAVRIEQERLARLLNSED